MLSWGGGRPRSGPRAVTGSWSSSLLCLYGVLRWVCGCRQGRRPHLAHAHVHAHLFHDLAQDLPPLLLRGRVAVQPEHVVQASPDAPGVLVVRVVEHLGREDQRRLVLLVRAAVPAPGAERRVRVELRGELDGHGGARDEHRP